MDSINGIITDIKTIFKRLQRLETQAQPRWVYLTTPLTSTSWDGDAKSDTASNALDLSAVFSAPAYIKAVLLHCEVRDSAAAENTNYFACGPSTAHDYASLSFAGGSDVYRYYIDVVPCDANGDLWYKIEASGAGTLDIHLQIYGYLI